MSQQPSGWYDDPSNPDMLRYWDGVTWTNHTAPKKSPTASQSTIGLPYQGQVPPDAGTTQGVPTPTSPMPQGSGWQTQQPQQYQQPQQQYQPYQQAPQYPGAPQNAQWMYNIKTTADGVPLASWGKRAAGWLIDGVILAVIGLPIAWAATPNLGRAISNYVDAVSSGNETAAANRLSQEIIAPTFQFNIIFWLIVTAYCVVFWTTVAQTPGKMALGISVRRMDQPGPLSIGTSLARRLVPLAGLFVSVLTLIDYLWPLWDDKRQALHDKVAKTQVVEGKQPKKQG